MMTRPPLAPAPRDELAVDDYLTDGDVLVQVLEVREFIAVAENVCDEQTIRIPLRQLRARWRHVTPGLAP